MSKKNWLIYRSFFKFATSKNANIILTTFEIDEFVHMCEYQKFFKIPGPKVGFKLGAQKFVRDVRM